MSRPSVQVSTTPTSWTGPELTAQQRVGTLIAGLSAANDAAGVALGDYVARHRATNGQSDAFTEMLICRQHPGRQCPGCRQAKGLARPKPRHRRKAHTLPVAAGSSFPAPGETATAGTSSRPVVAAELPVQVRDAGVGVVAANDRDGAATTPTAWLDAAVDAVCADAFQRFAVPTAKDEQR